MLRRRFNPLENLIDEMEKVDLSQPGANLPPGIDGKADSEEVERLELAFLRMMRRLEAERRRSSSAALRAQEEERARVARDLHDQVNQSLTGVLLRLEAAKAAAPPELEAEINETSLLAHQAMDELLAVARQLRPTALDDLGLKAAIAGQVEQLGRTGFEVELRKRRRPRRPRPGHSAGDLPGLPGGDRQRDPPQRRQTDRGQARTHGRNGSS